MPVSARYKALVSRERVLRRTFLPAIYSKTGIYDRRQQDGARAYRVLMHAELESYLEDMVAAVSNRADKAWTSRGTVSEALSAMLFSIDVSLDGPKKSGPNNYFHSLTRLAVDQQEKRIGNNHGIRQHNVIALMRSIGISEADIDTLLLANLNSFGILRGETAHSAVIGRITKQIDPQSEATMVNAIITGLQSLDGKLRSLR